VIVNLSTSGSDEALNSIGRLLNNGSIELLTQSGSILCPLPLSNPATRPAAAGELEFASIGEGVATSSGIAKFCRVLTADGSEVLSADVGDETSDAVVKLHPVSISARAPVRLSSFRLSMP
jgi:hypothetical protein